MLHILRERDFVCVCVGAFARVASLVQHATRKRHIVCASLVPPHFSTLSHKWYDFQKHCAEHKMCVLIFPTTFI